MTTAIQPVTFFIPSTAGEPIEVDVQHSGLRMVLVNREAVGRLGDEWRALGVYFLLGPSPSKPDRFQAYVGEVGHRDLLTRLVEHVRQKAWWNRALLIASVTSDGFNSAEIGWLEGRLYDVLNNATMADVMNQGRPGDDSIAPKNRGVLERYVEPVIAALRACGAPPDTADQRPVPRGKARSYFRESVKDLIDAGLLKSGTRLQPLRKHLTKTALVLEDGNLDIDGQVFTAVSTAAVAVSGSKSEPGWEFWGAPSGGGAFVPLYELRDRLRADNAAQSSAAIIQPSSARATGPDSAPPPTSPAIHRRRFAESLSDLIAARLVEAGEGLRTMRRAGDAEASITGDGRVRVGDSVYSSLSAAAVAASGNKSEPGWEYWAVVREGRLVPLYNLRDRLRETATTTPVPEESLADVRAGKA